MTIKIILSLYGKIFQFRLYLLPVDSPDIPYIIYHLLFPILKYAQQVRWYLINQEKLDKDRLKASSMGKDYPIDVNTTADGRNKNRRIEFIIE
jgi:hypothetical protein